MFLCGHTFVQVHEVWALSTLFTEAGFLSKPETGPASQLALRIPFLAPKCLYYKQASIPAHLYVGSRVYIASTLSTEPSP